jgi:hypothetical protein
MEKTLRRLRRLQNVPDSIEFSQRVGRVQLAPSGLEMTIYHNRGDTGIITGSLPWLINFGILEAGTVLN